MLYLRRDHPEGAGGLFRAARLAPAKAEVLTKRNYGHN